MYRTQAQIDACVSLLYMGCTWATWSEYEYIIVKLGFLYVSKLTGFHSACLQYLYTEAANLTIIISAKSWKAGCYMLSIIAL